MDRPTRSEQISRSFYAALGAKGLEARTKREWDDRIVEALVRMLPRGARVLDVGCGYGRIALPLAGYGLRIVGIDLSLEPVRAARDRAAQVGAEIRFDVGSMLDLPYGDGEFDVCLSLWSALNELLEPDERMRALSEMHRVLAPGGWALVEGPTWEPATERDLTTGDRSGGEPRISHDVIEGHPNPHLRHDATTLASLCRDAGIDEFETFERAWGGRTRLFLRFIRGPD